MTTKEKGRRSVFFIAEAAIIAALYVALTYLSNVFGLAYGEIQFRISEVLCIMPVFTPAAIPGLVIGCVISNLSSPYGLLDIVCGSLASLLAALATYALRNVRFKKIPVLATLPPVLFNAVIVGAEIWYTGGKTASLFFISALQVAAGEAAVCILLGIPFFLAVEKTGLFGRIKHKYVTSGANA